jgi:F0F1-type ATP synthase delta subunit
MNLNIIFIVFILQIIVALIVIFVLKKLLDRELIEAALEQLEVLRPKDDAPPFKSAEVISHADLNSETQGRVKNILSRRFKGLAVNFSTDSGLKGGVKVVIGAAVVDCTLDDRLQKMFGH